MNLQKNLTLSKLILFRTKNQSKFSRDIRTPFAQPIGISQISLDFHHRLLHSIAPSSAKVAFSRFHENSIIITVRSSDSRRVPHCFTSLKAGVNGGFRLSSESVTNQVLRCDLWTWVCDRSRSPVTESKLHSWWFKFRVILFGTWLIRLKIVLDLLIVSKFY